jgi:hypothetical protein
METLASGCLSAISPCGHQRKDPTTICGVCQLSRDSWRDYAEKEAIQRSIRTLRERGYTVIEPAEIGQ